MAEGILSSSISRRTVVKASLLAPAVAMIPVGLRQAAAQDSITVTMVTDTAGLGDQNFNDLADRGGKRAAEELGIEWKVIESADASAYVPNLTAGAEQGELTVGVGFLLTDAIAEVASQFPDDHFLLIDSTAEGNPNVAGMLFKEQEPSFLAGVVAGLSTKTNKIGIVGGQEIPPVIRYEVGFRAGVQSVNPEAAANISIVYTDTFGDAPLGQQTAEEQYSLGADIILPIAGATGIGCYTAAKERGEGFWVVGADTTQDHLAPGRELVTAQKGVDFAVYEGAKAELEGTFVGGTQNLGLKEGGVSLQDPYNRVPADIMALARAYEKLIIDGTLVVPVDYDTLEAFTPPPTPSVEASPVASPTA
jgi:basic membrane protein A